MYHLRVWLILIVLILSLTSSSLGDSKLIITGCTDPKFVRLGQSVTFNYTIKNNSNTTIFDITLNDSLIGSITLNKRILTPGASVRGTKKYIVAQKDIPGPIKSEALVNGKDSKGLLVVASYHLAIATAYSLGINLEIRPSKDAASLGDNITYVYLVKNVGDITLNNITLKDDKLGLVSLNSTRLGPGNVATGKKSLIASRETIPGALLNNATVEGTTARGYNVSGFYSATVFLLKPSNANTSESNDTGSTIEPAQYNSGMEASRL